MCFYFTLSTSIEIVKEHIKHLKIAVQSWSQMTAMENQNQIYYFN